eukprot:gnl/TRDRNA2_/TRDRNA2_148721_c0_seq1.p1 gnl/TRDRNA2_/TRDRNA2_148721_c0~~gnl/TRDRNA2_/TRDRNA2_148721_c0_seq1.p1  ORF type:complete len:182 (-),score=43.73 gnl/TRDRNA2_/TRDRNA2_148721_c0_seq1:59-604(-)
MQAEAEVQAVKQAGAEVQAAAQVDVGAQPEVRIEQADSKDEAAEESEPVIKTWLEGEHVETPVLETGTLADRIQAATAHREELKEMDPPPMQRQISPYFPAKSEDRLLDNLLNFCPQTFKMALLEGIGAFSCCRPQQTAESYDGDAPVMPVHGDDSGLKIKPLPVLPPSDWKKGIEKAMGA